MGFIIRGFIWDIPILIFAYVLFWGPRKERMNPERQAAQLALKVEGAGCKFVVGIGIALGFSETPI